MFSCISILALCLWQVQLYAYAAPMPVPRTIANAARSDMWTARDFRWSCVDGKHSCIYDFIVEESAAGDHGSNSTLCHFSVQAEESESIGRSSFSNIPCEQSAHHLYGGSWGSNGYFVLTVDNVEENLRAYFGYSDDEINSGQTFSPHHSLGYMVSNIAVSGRTVPASVLPTDPVKRDADSQDNARNSDEHGPVDMATSTSNVDNNAGFSIKTIARDPPQDQEKDDQGVHNDGQGLVDISDERSTELGEPVIIGGDGPRVYTTALLADPVDACPADPAEAAPDRSTDTFEPVKLSHRDPSPSVPSVAKTWSVKNVTRSLRYGPNSVHADFLIDVLPSGPTDIPCTIQVDLNNSQDPAFASWYVKPCQRSGWYLSWGYNTADDSAVATLISPDRSEEAWFGWEKVNSDFLGTTLSDIGPSIVQTCNC